MSIQSNKKMYLPFFLCFVFYFVFCVLWWVSFLFCVLWWGISCKTPTSAGTQKTTTPAQHNQRFLNKQATDISKLSHIFTRQQIKIFEIIYSFSTLLQMNEDVCFGQSTFFQSSPFNFIHLQSSPGTFNHLQSKLVPPFLRSDEIKRQPTAISSHTCFQDCSWLLCPRRR